MIENPFKALLFRPRTTFFVQKKLLRSVAKHVKSANSATNIQPETKILKVAFIGVPNAGKSTLINSLMDRRVCAVSSRVHTTRARAMAVFTQGDSQIVFLDTPGVINDKEKKKFVLEKRFTKDSNRSLIDADVIGVVHDSSNPHTREMLDIKIIRLLESQKKKPSFLVLNKVDLLKSKRKLLDLAKVLTENHINGIPIPGKFSEHENKGWRHFKEIFMVSALSGDGTDDVKNFLFRNAKPGDWLFPEEIWTDQTPELLIVNNVKAVLLNFLPQEIPYNLKPQLEYFDVASNGEINAVVLVKCPSSRIANLVAGDSDGKLRQITASVQRDLQEAFNTFVKIRIVLYPREENKE